MTTPVTDDQLTRFQDTCTGILRTTRSRPRPSMADFIDVTCDAVRARFKRDDKLVEIGLAEIEYLRARVLHLREQSADRCATASAGQETVEDLRRQLAEVKAKSGQWEAMYLRAAGCLVAQVLSAEPA